MVPKTFRNIFIYIDGGKVGGNDFRKPIYIYIYIYIYYIILYICGRKAGGKPLGYFAEAKLLNRRVSTETRPPPAPKRHRRTPGGKPGIVFLALAAARKE